jgi:hypothetical protein
MVRREILGMANRPAPALVLRPGDPEELQRWMRASTVSAASAKRARIVLLAAEGTANMRIAELVVAAGDHDAAVAQPPSASGTA